MKSEPGAGKKRALSGSRRIRSATPKQSGDGSKKSRLSDSVDEEQAGRAI